MQSSLTNNDAGTEFRVDYSPGFDSTTGTPADFYTITGPGSPIVTGQNGQNGGNVWLAVDPPFVGGENYTLAVSSGAVSNGGTPNDVASGVVITNNVPPPPDPSTLPSPLFRYRLDEGAGTTAANSFAAPVVGAQADYDMTLTSSPAWIAGGVQLGNGKYMRTGVFGSPLVTSAYTFHVATNRNLGSVDGFNYHPTLGDGATWFFQEVVGARHTSSMGATSNLGALVRADEWTITTITYDSTTLSIYTNGVLTGTLAASATLTSNRINIGGFNGGGDPITFFGGAVGYAMGFAECHSVADVRIATEAIRTDLNARGCSITAPAIFANEGDSIGEGYYATQLSDGYAFLAARSLGTAAVMSNFALSGSFVSTLAARAAALDAQVWPGKKNVLNVYVGTNDLQAGTVAAYVAALKSYCVARRAAGWKVVLCNMLTDAANTPGTQGVDANAALAADSSFRDVLTDFGSLTGVTLHDALHPDTAGHAAMSVPALAAVQAALAL